MSVLALEGVPYTPDMIAKAEADIKAQLNPDDPSVADLRQALSQGRRSREPRRRQSASTEQDALVAYLQMLGTLVDFKLYNDKANLR